MLGEKKKDLLDFIRNETVQVLVRQDLCLETLKLIQAEMGTPPLRIVLWPASTTIAKLVKDDIDGGGFLGRRWRMERR